MAILYKANETTFNHLGLGVLNDAVSILVTEERNGVFELEMAYPVSGSLFANLKLDRLIKADAGHNLKNQRFKIIRITKPMSGIVTVYGEHVSYLTQDLSLQPSVSYSGSASIALGMWKNAIVGVETNPFTTYSDIATTGSGIWSIKDVKNAREALGGVDGSLLDTYGGEYLFDNYDIKLYANRGKQSGALIAYGRNLTDLEQEENIADTYTSIYPYAVMTDDNQNEIILTLPEYYLDSEYVSNYARRKILTVDFSNDDVATVEQLRAKAADYIINNRIGVPKVNLKIKYVDLAKTLDYEATQALEEVNVCDWVTIYFEEYGIKTNEKIIKTVWDDLLKQYDSIEVGEARASLAQSINTTVEGKLETVAVNLNTVRLAADGKTKIYTGVAEPVASGINDLWYKPVDSGAVEMYRWDGVIWSLQKTSANALAGTVDFATVQAINIDANSITTGTLSGSNMWLNLITGEMQFTNPTTGDILALDQAKIMFQNGSNIRYFQYNEEGWVLEPGAGNVGTAGNTGLILKGGDGAHKYIDGINTDYNDREHHQRITMINDVIRLHSWGAVEIRDNQYFDGRDVYNYIRAKAFLMGGSGSVGMYEDANSWTNIDGTNGVALYAGGQEILAAYSGSPNEVDIFGNVDLNGGTILNQSDVRLKLNVVDSLVDPFSIIEKMRFIEFEWDKTNPYNKDKPEGIQFGIEAQYSPFLSVKDNGSNYLSINMGKQVNLNSMVNQKLVAELKSVKQELADLKTLLTEKGVI